MKTIIALLAGIIFGIGLVLSGMTNPTKVIGFLDISSSWDPSLAFVMAGAISVAFPAFYYAKKHTNSALGEKIELPEDNNTVDYKLIGGAITFGIGWGLSGYCPGPAITSLLTGGYAPFIFSLGLVMGVLIHFQLTRKS